MDAALTSDRPVQRPTFFVQPALHAVFYPGLEDPIYDARLSVALISSCHGPLPSFVALPGSVRKYAAWLPVAHGSRGDIHVPRPQRLCSGHPAAAPDAEAKTLAQAVRVDLGVGGGALSRPDPT